MKDSNDITTNHSDSISCLNPKTCSLQADYDAIKIERDHLQAAAFEDPLTGLYNYRHFEQNLEHELERSIRTGQATTLMMIDIDHFKAINDQYGHESGNITLIQLGQTLLSALRKLDIACRYGGEEFAIILPSTDLLTGTYVAERIRHTVETMVIELDDQTLSITVSIGVASYSPTQESTTHQLIEQADAALYEAKRSGRNRVNSAPNDRPTSISDDEKDALHSLFN